MASEQSVDRTDAEKSYAIPRTLHLYSPRTALLEIQLNAFIELHFPVLPQNDKSLPSPDPVHSPYRLRVRRYWPTGAGYRNPRDYSGRPQFSHRFKSNGEPIFVDARSRTPWNGKLEELIDADWATDPSLVEDADLSNLAQHIRVRAIAGEYGRGIGGEETLVFRDAKGKECTLKLSVGAKVDMYPWKSGELTMPPKGRVIKMSWTYLRTETESQASKAKDMATET